MIYQDIIVKGTNSIDSGVQYRLIQIVIFLGTKIISNDYSLQINNHFLLTLFIIK